MYEIPELNVDHIVHLWLAEVPARCGEVYTDGCDIYLGDEIIIGRTLYYYEVIWLRTPRSPDSIISRFEKILRQHYMYDKELIYRDDVLKAKSDMEDKFWDSVENPGAVRLIQG